MFGASATMRELEDKLQQIAYQFMMTDNGLGDMPFDRYVREDWTAELTSLVARVRADGKGKKIPGVVRRSHVHVTPCSAEIKSEYRRFLNEALGMS